MMQATLLDHSFSAMITDAASPLSEPDGPASSMAPSMGLAGLSPASMAMHLLRTNPASARCFAEAMYERSAWANEEWGEYWADVISLV